MSETRERRSMGRMPVWRRERLPRKVEVGLLVGVLVVALGLRVTYLQVTGIWHRPPEHDGIEYDFLAVHLLDGEGFSLADGEPYGFRPPGLPVVMALLYAVFGQSYLAVRLMNVVLGALTCLPIYYFTKRVWRWQTGVIAALGVAAHPLLIYFTGMIYPESLIIFLIAIVFLLANWAMASGRIAAMVPLGLVSAVLIYVRPSLLLFGLGHVVWVWFSRETIRKRLVAGGVLVAVILLLIVPWSVRNWIVFDEFIWMATEGGVTFWASNNPLATGGWVEPSPETWLGPDPPRDLRGWPGLTETESEARFIAAGVEWIWGHPVEFLRLLPRKIVRAWGINFGNEARQSDLPAPVSVAYSLFLLVCLIGFVLSLSRWREAMVLYLMVGVSTVTTLIFYGSTRQSSILILPLVIFAALALDRALLAVAEGLSSMRKVDR